MDTTICPLFPIQVSGGFDITSEIVISEITGSISIGSAKRFIQLVSVVVIPTIYTPLPKFSKMGLDCHVCPLSMVYKKSSEEGISN